MSLYGFIRRSLSVSGTVAAFVVGFITTLSDLRFAAVLVTFFLSSSWWTKRGKHIKAKIDDEFKEGGQRDWWQVLCNGSVATIFAGANLLNRQRIGGLSPDPPTLTYAVGFLAAYACCCGDTWASEIGPLFDDVPRLITTGRAVPKGTNGGVTLVGFLASAAGGFVVALAYLVTDWFLLVPSAPNQPTRLSTSQAITVGLFGGLVGSLIDSVLGATLQLSALKRGSATLVTSTSANSGKHISGINLLSNHQVNFVSSLFTSLISILLFSSPQAQ